MSRTITRIAATGAGALLALGLFATAPAGATGGERDGGGKKHKAACFNDDGKTQGRSHSDPDGDGNGGFDKPGCTGGFDADRDGNNGCGNDADREDDNNGNCGPQRDRDRGCSNDRRGDNRGNDKDGRKNDDRGNRCGDGDGSGSSTTTTSTSTTTTTTVVPIDPSVDPSTEPSDCEVDPNEADGCDTAVSASGATGGPGLLAATPDGTTADPAATNDGAATDGTSADPADGPTTEVLGETLERPGTLARTGLGVGGLTLLGGLLCGGGRLAALARRLTRIG